MHDNKNKLLKHKVKVEHVIDARMQDQIQTTRSKYYMHQIQEILMQKGSPNKKHSQPPKVNNTRPVLPAMPSLNQLVLHNFLPH